MNYSEMYVSAYFERVKHCATVANLRFRGPAGDAGTRGGPDQ